MEQNNKSITVTIRNLQKKLSFNRLIAKKIKKAVIKTLEINKKWAAEITVCILDNKTIRELNLLYLAEDCATDCLSFDITEKKEKKITADIAVSAETAIKNSKVYKTTPKQELLLYVVHGVLHILGFDDDTEKKRSIMDREAKKILLLCQYTKQKH